MLRQIEIDQLEAKRTAALMGLALMLALAVGGIILMRDLRSQSLMIDKLLIDSVCHQSSPFGVGFGC
jgi:hypothetical protein